MPHSLSDEFGGEVVKVTMRAADFTGRNFSEILPVIAAKLKDAKTIKSIRYFSKSNAAIDNVIVPAEHMKAFINQCRRLGVKVAVTKDAANPKDINITFRSGQSSLIEQAILGYRGKTFSRKANKGTIGERIASAIKRARENAVNRPKKSLVIPERRRGAR